MVLQKLSSLRRRESGFTIVELLIVIVVIGILAGITIVTYNGVTARANTTKAQTNAVQVQKVAEAFNADTAAYPKLTADFTDTDNTATLPAGISLFYTGGTGVNATPSASNGATTVWYQWCGNTSSISTSSAAGGRVRYWDFSAGALSTTIIYVGAGVYDASTPDAPAEANCNTFFTPAS